ncbi:hypothetical protein EVAR_12288_1 [Eumeta japonica]|uniref:Uncharacterized protein n=1 Tax=Eumeta variegata TaxID=151549 RepID=A0A4C1TU94_EUMVA|nr:hypothetical protein EVAR_12288_1 [Eumeta japonica]
MVTAAHGQSQTQRSHQRVNHQRECLTGLSGRNNMSAGGGEGLMTRERGDASATSATSATADGLAPEGASQTKKFCLQVIKKRPRKPDVADVHEWCSAATDIRDILLTTSCGYGSVRVDV